MNNITRNILAVLGGLVIGCIVNLSLVSIGPHVVPLPEGADVSDMDSLQESMKLFTPTNFLFPFLGHALGTLAGAFMAARLAASHCIKLAMVIGAFFQLGGISVANMIGGPTWFIAGDLLLACIPMAIAGVWFAGKTKPNALGAENGAE